MSPWKALLPLFVAVFGGACATAGPLPLRPCYETRPAIVVPEPCAELDAPACAERMAFVRRAFGSTVYVHVSRYDPKDGLTYAAGTGAVIDSRGYVLTAWHVVRDARTISIGTRRLGDNDRDVVRVRDAPMELVSHDAPHDVALLRPAVADETLPPPFAIRDEATAIGERLWHFGHVSVWQHGRVLRLGQESSGISGLVEVDFPCRHGDSGGPFVTPDGELAGVLLSMSGSRDGEGHTYFLPVGEALRVLAYEAPSP